MKFKDILDGFIDDDEAGSLRKLEPKVCIHHGQLSDYLHGILPTPKNAIKLANYFKCSLDYLFGFDNNFKVVETIRELDPKGFYAKYEKLLKTNKITHNALADKIAINKTSLSRWKNGYLPSMQAIIEIADYFGESIDYLICK